MTGARVRAGVVLSVVLVALSLARPARAQACCTATGSSGFGVVGRCHFAALAAQLAYERGHGSFDARGRYRTLRGAEVDDVVLSLGGGIRLGTPAWQIYGSVPLRLQYRDLGGLAPAGAVGPGDASVGLRYMAVEDLVTGIDVHDARTFVPFVEPFVGVRAPTGRGPTGSKTPSGVDATGDGAWTAFAGVAVTKFLTLRDALVLVGSWGYRFPHDVAAAGGGARRFSPGQEVRARLAFVRVFNLFWSGSVFASVIFTSDVAQDGQRVPYSATRRVRFGASLMRYVVYPYWKLGLSASLDPPIEGFGQNIPFASASVACLVQRNFTW